MLPNDFYYEKKWCDHCKRYVRYLIGQGNCYCVQCGGKVVLFNKEDLARFEKALERKKYKAS